MKRVSILVIVAILLLAGFGIGLNTVYNNPDTFVSEYDAGTDGYITDSIAYVHPSWSPEKVEDCMMMQQLDFDIKYNVDHITYINDSIIMLVDENNRIIGKMTVDEYINTLNYGIDYQYTPEYSMEIKGSTVFIKDIETGKIYVTTVDSIGELLWEINF